MSTIMAPPIAVAIGWWIGKNRKTEGLPLS